MWEFKQFKYIELGDDGSFRILRLLNNEEKIFERVSVDNKEGDTDTDPIPPACICPVAGHISHFLYQKRILAYIKVPELG
jgi:hypothetical protein